MPDENSLDPTTPVRRIALVAGYHPCSFPPPVAYDAGLRERFAVVLDSYRPDKDGMFFDADLFVRLAAALLRAVPHDSLAVETTVCSGCACCPQAASPRTITQPNAFRTCALIGGSRR